MGPADQMLAKEILVFNVARFAKAEADGDKKKMAKAFLKPLRETASARGEVAPLKVQTAGERLGTFHQWLSSDVTRDRVRDI